MGARLLIFTPVTPSDLQFATVQSVVNQRFTGEIRWEIGRCNPYPPPDMRNVLAQYSYARELALRGPYDALVTIEQDMIVPPHALATLWDDGAAVAYGTYMLRHGQKVINALKLDDGENPGMSLSLYSPSVLASLLEQKASVEVSGVGFGCTLIRRHVLEAISFRQDSSGNAPDMPFALDCLRMGYEQIARFDVSCGHFHEGVILETQQNNDWVTVTAKEDCNVLIDGKSVTLSKGDQVEMPAAAAKDYAALGYVEVSTGPAATTGTPTAPKVPRQQ